MLPKNKRLATQQFDTAFSAGQVIRTPHFLIRHHTSPLKNQWAVVIPKKHIRTAAARNTLRRQIYSAIEMLLKENKSFTGHYIVILTKKETLCIAEIYNEIHSAVTRRML
ncbi:ribonuclease P protein component [Candidatus Campbellbacteria bacterium]|nr:MAG: ribonuclease P protein component [Candidatus Campbellbacteria bacterium]